MEVREREDTHGMDEVCVKMGILNVISGKSVSPTLGISIRSRTVVCMPHRGHKIGDTHGNGMS